MQLRSRQVPRTPPATSRPMVTPSTDGPPTCRLLALPAELKNEIYRLATLQDDAIKVTADGYQRPALLNTCKEVRSEALKIWYYESRFRFDLQDYNSDTLYRFVRSIRGFGIASGKVDYSALISYVPASWTNLVCWLRRYHAKDVRDSPPKPASLLQSGHNLALEYFLATMFVTVKAMRDKPWKDVEELMENFRPSLIAQDSKWEDD